MKNIKINQWRPPVQKGISGNLNYVAAPRGCLCKVHNNPLFKATLSRGADIFWSSEGFPSHTRQWQFFTSTVHQSWLLVHFYIYMGVGTIGYLIKWHLNGNPSVLKSSWTLTLYPMKGARDTSYLQSLYRFMPLVMYAVEHVGISIAIYATNYR